MVSARELRSRTRLGRELVKKEKRVVAEQESIREATEAEYQKQVAEYEKKKSEAETWQKEKKAVWLHQREYAPKIIGYAVTPEERKEVFRIYGELSRKGELEAWERRMGRGGAFMPFEEFQRQLHEKEETIPVGAEPYTPPEKEKPPAWTGIDEQRYLGELPIQQQEREYAGTIGVWKEFEGEGVTQTTREKIAKFVRDKIIPVYDKSMIGQVEEKVGGLFKAGEKYEKERESWYKQTTDTGDVIYKSVTPADAVVVQGLMDVYQNAERAEVELRNKAMEKLQSEVKAKQVELQGLVNFGKMDSGEANIKLEQYNKNLADKYSKEMKGTYEKYTTNLIQQQTNLSEKQSKVLAKKYSTELAVKNLPKTVAETLTWIGLASVIPAYRELSISRGALGIVGGEGKQMITQAKQFPEATAITAGGIITTLLVTGAITGLVKGKIKKSAFLKEAKKTKLKLAGVSMKMSPNKQYLILEGIKKIKGKDYNVRINYPIQTTKYGYVSLAGGKVSIDYIDKAGRKTYEVFRIKEGSKAFKQAQANWQKVMKGKMVGFDSPVLPLGISKPSGFIGKISKQLKGSVIAGEARTSRISKTTLIDKKPTKLLGLTVRKGGMKVKMKTFLKSKEELTRAVARGEGVGKPRDIIMSRDVGGNLLVSKKVGTGKLFRFEGASIDKVLKTKGFRIVKWKDLLKRELKGRRISVKETDLLKRKGYFGQFKPRENLILLDKGLSKSKFMAKVRSGKIFKERHLPTKTEVLEHEYFHRLFPSLKEKTIRALTTKYRMGYEGGIISPRKVSLIKRQPIKTKIIAKSHKFKATVLAVEPKRAPPMFEVKPIKESFVKMIPKKTARVDMLKPSKTSQAFAISPTYDIKVKQVYKPLLTIEQRRALELSVADIAVTADKYVTAIDLPKIPRIVMGETGKAITGIATLKAPQLITEERRIDLISPQQLRYQADLITKKKERLISRTRQIQLQEKQFILQQPQRVIQIQPPKQRQRLIQTPLQRHKPRLIQRQLVTDITLPRTKVIPPTTVPALKIGYKFPPFQVLKKAPVKAKALIIPQAYIPLIKRQGKWYPISKPLKKGQAIWIGAEKTRKELGATFKLKKVAIKPTKSKIPSIAVPPTDMFRGYKIVKGKRVKMKDMWIEKRKFRLDVPSEVKEIVKSRRQGRLLI